ncbi:hypothetical protein F4780DRAFT_577164 [Xylariomycetidae sp. FL0641]|nr:hypothetical protein F4780DRAFT_577164 [Xylariomycetidae sp. FL0641]
MPNSVSTHQVLVHLVQFTSCAWTRGGELQVVHTNNNSSRESPRFLLGSAAIDPSLTEYSCEDSGDEMSCRHVPCTKFVIDSTLRPGRWWTSVPSAGEPRRRRLHPFANPAPRHHLVVFCACSSAMSVEGHASAAVEVSNRKFWWSANRPYLVANICTARWCYLRADERIAEGSVEEGPTSKRRSSRGQDAYLPGPVYYLQAS